VTPFALLLAAIGLSTASELTIPHEKYSLENGLEVILAPDDSTPIAFVQIWYHVGSSRERPGLTGFAHLFEHLMFQGSQNAPGEFFIPLQEVGANVNGTTSSDRTEYHETVPSQHLPLALFMESDRLGWFLPVLDQQMLDNQREVVRNERRQRYENPPYGEVRVDLHAAVWPEDHPYHHLTIGSHEDLEAADLEAVREFFRTWYVPNNASLVISGHFDAEQTKALVAQYFGAIPAGAAPPKLEVAPAQIPESMEIHQHDDVPEQKVWMVWISPALYEPGDAELDLLSSVLSGGKDSRLYRELVKERQIAKDIAAYQSSMELGSMYYIMGTAAKGHTTDEIVAAVDEVLAEVLGDAPPTEEELEAARAQFEVGFYDQLTTVAGKGSVLSRYNHYTGSPDFLHRDLQRYLDADVAAVSRWGAEVLKRPRVVLHVWPDDEEGN
jgi:predicted Zn-dependent peptidase